MKIGTQTQEKIECMFTELVFKLTSIELNYVKLIRSPNNS